jgi:cytochrome c oxidase cbb3-type subunit 3
MRLHFMALLLFACTLSAQEESSARITNPFTTAEDRAAGAKIYQSQCASCHGLDGKGGQGTPDFTAGQFRRASSEEGLFQIVAKGITGTTMPAFNLDGKQIWQLLTHIRAFSYKRVSAGAQGNPEQGRELFRTHNCARCHDANAPDLSRLANNRNAAELRRAIEEPNADVDSAWWRIRITLHSGQTLAGRRLNEDSHSIQILDSQGNLRTADKSQIAASEIQRTSPMPSFRGKLQPEEWNHLLAYLISGDLK